MAMFVKRFLLPGRRTQISILLTIIALLLWSHSILYARLEIGHWGLINGLPLTFFVALAFLTVASAILWVAKERHEKLLCLQLLILILALYSVPLITGGSQPFINHGYRNIGYVDYIVRQNHFDTQASSYFSWPGAFILAAIIGKIGLIDFEPLIEVLPIILPILSLPLLYIFLKNTLGEARRNYCWAGCWLFYLAAWGGAGNLTSAMGTALFLLMVILALITSPSLWRKDTKPFALISLIAVAFAATVIAHLLTSLAALCIIIALCIARLDKRLALAVGACLLLLLAWTLTGARSYIKTVLPQEGKVAIVQPELPPAETLLPGEVSPGKTPSTEEAPRRGMIILDPEVLAEREVIGHISGSQSHADVVRVRILFTGMFVLIGLWGLISALVMRKNFKTTIAILAITVAPIVLVTLSGHYAREILTRIYGLSLPGMAYFGANLFDVKKRAVPLLLCLLLIIAIPLHVIATYGNQELDYFSPGQKVGTDFFHEDTSQGLVFGAWPAGTVKNIEHYNNTDLEWLEWDDSRLVMKGPFKDLPYYIGISRQGRALYEWFQGNTDFINEIDQRLQSTVNCNFIYNNPDLKLYICEAGGS
jgi:hypothetical protein